VTDDPLQDLVLDGNAVAGSLVDAFGEEMTATSGECASCGNVAPLAGLVAYTRGPGIVLRCPACTAVMIRIARTRQGIFVDVQGARGVAMPPAALRPIA